MGHYLRLEPVTWIVHRVDPPAVGLFALPWVTWEVLASSTATVRGGFSDHNAPSRLPLHVFPLPSIKGVRLRWLASQGDKILYLAG